MTKESSVMRPVRRGQQTSMLSVDDLAERLQCSTRHVRRLADAGRIPRPVKLGALIRWRVETIEQWEEDGYPNFRKAATRRRR